VKTLPKRSLLVFVALAAAQVAFAGGPGGKAGAAAGAGVTSPGANATVGGASTIGAGAAAASPSQRALDNSNGQIVEERKFGQDRAMDRRSDQGAEHEKATQALEDKASGSASDPGKAGASASSSTDTSTTASGRLTRRPAAGTSADPKENKQ
jgi:hypothetical protein